MLTNTQREALRTAIEVVMASGSGQVVVPFPGRTDMIIWRKGTKVLLTAVKKGSTLSLGKGAEGLVTE